MFCRVWTFRSSTLYVFNRVAVSRGLSKYGADCLSYQNEELVLRPRADSRDGLLVTPGSIVRTTTTTENGVRPDLHYLLVVFFHFLSERF